MATFAIESNGRLEKTVVYFNGQQLGGIKEVFLNLDEDGTFDAILQYEGTDKQIRTKQIFDEYLEDVKITEPSFTDEEAEELHLLSIDSDGDIEDTIVKIDNEELDGIVSLFVHIKSAENKNGISVLFSKNKIPEHVEFKAEITFRNEDDTTETEEIF
ncbi:MAG: hypothetical protein HZB41_06265 [Ignavibacteriae bacterium]|nr:hypothetical protein [Ignavibacteriota bacterium]